MPVGDHCRRSFSRARAEEAVREAAVRMKAENTGCLIVVDDQDRPVGTLTDRDIAMQVLRRGRDPDKTEASEVMSTDLLAADRRTSTLELLAKLEERCVRRIPLLEAGKVVGSRSTIW